MQDLIKYIVTQLVNNPDAVSIDEQRDENSTVNFLLTVDPEDMGIVIGKGGQTIKSIRRILTVLAMNENVRVNLQLVEPLNNNPEASADSKDLVAGEVEAEKAAEEDDLKNDEDAEDTEERAGVEEEEIMEVENKTSKSKKK